MLVFARGGAYTSSMGRQAKSIDLFAYTDYRSYLKEWYARAKASRGGFSFRAFSKQAGFNSPNFYKLVMDGERNLTQESLARFVIGLGLNKQEEAFFRNLVFFNQAKTHDQKDFYYQRLLQSRKFNQLKPIERHQYDFYSTWYHPVVRELVTSPQFDGTAEWISQRLYPSVTVPQVKKSLDLLETLGLVVRTPEGGYRQTDTLISTGPEAQSLVLLNYHQAMLGIAKEILPEVAAKNRDVSTLTLGIKRERIGQIKKRIQEFRQDILKLVSTDTQAEEVVVLAFQLLPLTILEKGRPL